MCWAFYAPSTWKQTECFPLTFLGQHIMLLAKLAPISSYPDLFVAAWWHAAKEVGECILCIIAFESPQLFNTLHTFRHPCIVLNSCQWCFSDQLFNFQCFASFHIQLLSTSPPETARVTRNCESHSFIICVQYALGLGVQHLKLI